MVVHSLLYAGMNRIRCLGFNLSPAEEDGTPPRMFSAAKVRQSVQ